VRNEDGRVATADGLALYWRAWTPERARAALLFVHGLAEHSGRYAGPAGFFASRGYACYAVDLRGHGRSPGPRVDVSSFDRFLADVGATHALVRERHPGVKTFLVGHSQGGLLVLQYALRHPEGLPGVVASSPVLAVHPASRPSRARELAARVLRRVAPRLRIPSGLDARWLSRDPEVVAAYLNDPLVSRRVSARWFASLLQAQEEVEGGAAAFPVPALVMAASADRLVDPEATRRFAERAPRGLVRLVCWEGLFHELFNEPEKEEVLGAVERWLAPRL